MSQSDSGDLNTSNRAKLFPLPFLSLDGTTCSSPVPSARIRFRRKTMRTINVVTNRVIFTLNRLYSPQQVTVPHVHPASSSSSSASAHDASIIDRPILASASNIRCQPSQSTATAGVESTMIPPAPQQSSSSSKPSSRSRLPYRLLPSASRVQQRLIEHIRKQCATFVLAVRSSESSDASDIESKAMDVFTSYQFGPSSDRGSPDQHQPTIVASNAVTTLRSSVVYDRTSSRSDPIEGPLFDRPTSASSDALPLASTFSSSATAVVPLIAHRIALPESLNIVPLVNVLPPEMAARYANDRSPTDADSLLRPRLDVLALNLTAPLKPARIAGSRSEYVKLIRRMLAQCMILFTAHPKAVNGVFTVGKDADTDRLIIDAQPANRLFIDAPHVALPDPSHLVQLRVPVGSQMYVGKSDLSNYYHHLGLPAWMQPYFSLPALTPDELASLGLPSDAAYPMCVTLPMGFSHAVLLAQSSHEHVVYSSGVLSRDHNLLRLASPDVTSARAVHGIVIDDFFLFSLDLSLARRTFDRVLAAYRTAGFVVKSSKVVSPTADPVKVIGFMIHRNVDQHTTVALSSDACMDLARATLAMLHRGLATGLGLAHIIGRWTWSMLLRRSSLAVLQHSYRYIQVADRRRFTIWPSVRRELWMLLGLLPLLHARLDVPTFRHAVASDASELGAGVVCSTLTPEMSERVWQLCSSRSHATMQTLANAAVMRGEDIAASPVLLQQAAEHYSAFYADVLTTRWSTIISSAWKTREHINALELRAVLLALHWLLSYPSAHLSRVYLLVDSTVALFALWKGRSSSARLLLILRKISALLLASGSSFLTGWLPSAVNPADRPSRLVDDDDQS